MSDQLFRNFPRFKREPYIIYRLPGEHHFVIFKIGRTEILKGNEKPFKDGFLFAPFKMTDHKFACFKASKVHAYSIGTGLKIPTSTFYTEPHAGKSVDKDDYIDRLNETIELVKTESKTEKIVLSRSYFKPVDQFENFGPFFSRLMDAYPRSFVYLLNHPDFGTWCGASPELLFSSNNGDGSTVALASTRKLEAFSDEDVVWNEKEIVEQHLVEKYIEEKLQEKNCRYTKKGPETILTGRLAHICSWYEFPIPKKEQFEFVKELHPTPAICGLPKKEAFRHLKKLENYDREYYSGFLGPMGEEGTHLFVNLRCFKVFSNGLNLYAGGGITRDSVPELEWTETCNKLDSILRLL